MNTPREGEDDDRDDPPRCSSPGLLELLQEGIHKTAPGGRPATSIAMATIGITRYQSAVPPK
jgi:hypothetical protein